MYGVGRGSVRLIGDVQGFGLRGESIGNMTWRIAIWGGLEVWDNSKFRF